LGPALVYLILAAAWVLFSDRAVSTSVADVHSLTSIQTIKGWAFVLFSTVLVGALSLGQHRARERLVRQQRAIDSAALAAYRALLDRLSALEQGFGSSSDLPGVYRALRDFIVDTAPCDLILVTRCSEDTGGRVATYLYLEGQEPDMRDAEPLGQADAPGERAVRTRGVVVAEGEPVAWSSTGRFAAASSVAVPMVVGDTVAGVLEVGSSQGHAYSDEHVAGLRMAANLLAIALQNADLWERERAARRAVEASEARFRSLVQNSSDIVRLLDRNGAIVYESPAVTRVLGYEPGSRPPDAAFDRIHPDDVERAKQELARAMKDGFGQATYRVRHANGEWRWFESVGVSMFDDPNVGAFVLNSRDITDRKRVEEALREERAFNQTIVDNLPGVFYVIDERGNHHQWNGNYARLLGYGVEDMRRLRALDLIDADDRELVAGRIREVFEKGSASCEARLVAKDGRRIPYLLTGALVKRGGERYLAGVGLDLSAQKAAREEIASLNAELQDKLERITTLHEIDNTISSSTSLGLTLSVVLKQVMSCLKVDASGVLLYDSDTDRLRYCAARGLNGKAIRSTDLSLGEGLPGMAALQRRLLFVEGPAETGRELARLGLFEEEGIESYVAAPLVARGKLLGVLELFHRSRTQRDEDWFSFLDTLVTQVAIALDNATLVENLQRSNAELRIAYDTTIEGWARTLDLRHEDTEWHSRRVTDLTVRLAERMGVRGEELVRIRRGALLHDIGKMAVPDDILLKPGKLTAEEWEVMKRHTTYAYELLSPIPFLQSAIDIPYCHHERWDGTGYPRGLRGEQIPLAARIFSVVDVFDALTSDRPYRRAWSKERALAYLREQAGTQFDPAAVEAFLEMIEDDDVLEDAFGPAPETAAKRL
jgi:PAS domain S-box-containing protein/putative nucleotidyltransferase with HDIG domain